MADTLFISEILKGISNGFLQGMQMKRQKQEFDAEQGLKTRELDLREKALMGEGAAKPLTAIQEAQMQQMGFDKDPATGEWVKTRESVAEKGIGMREEDMQRRKEQFESGKKIVGFGSEYALTPQVAKPIREAYTGAKQAGFAVDKILDLTKDIKPGQKILPARFNELKAKVQQNRVALKAGIRIAITGGGNISEGEQKMLDEIAADPTQIVRNPQAARAALQSLKENSMIGAILTGKAGGINFKDSDYVKLGISPESFKYAGSPQTPAQQPQQAATPQKQLLTPEQRAALISKLRGK